MVHKQATAGQALLAVLGVIGAGIVLLVVGSSLKSHFQLNAAVCNTFGGPVGTCTGSESLFTLGQFLQPIGGIFIGLGVIGGVFFAVSKNSAGQERRPSGPGSGQSARAPYAGPRAIVWPNAAQHKGPAGSARTPPPPSQQWTNALTAAAVEPHPRSVQLKSLSSRRLSGEGSGLGCSLQMRKGRHRLSSCIGSGSR